MSEVFSDGHEARRAKSARKWRRESLAWAWFAIVASLVSSAAVFANLAEGDIAEAVTCAIGAAALAVAAYTFYRQAAQA